MLGYSETEIQQLLSGDARLSALDRAYQLEAMGYSPEEIEEILKAGKSRREVDSAYGQRTIAAAVGGDLSADSLAGGAKIEPGSEKGESPDTATPKFPAADTQTQPSVVWSGIRRDGVEKARILARPYLGVVRTTAQRFQVDPALILAVISAESDFRPRAVSPKGAMGLMQLMPHTGEIYGATMGQLFDPGINIVAGTQFLAECLSRFEDERLALAAYNAGPSRVALYKAVPPIRETQRYVAKVLRLRQEYRALIGPDIGTSNRLSHVTR
jgi:soluble lytic murein transglycosylase-like protein